MPSYSNIGTINNSYKQLCRACIDNAFKDSENPEYAESLQDYIDSDNLLMHCILAELADDVVTNELKYRLSKIYDTIGVLPRGRSNSISYLMWIRTELRLPRPLVANLIGLTSKDLFDYEWGFRKLDSELASKLAKIYKCELRDLLLTSHD